jgi:hypothetical protein
VGVRGDHRIPNTAQRHREQIALLAQGRRHPLVRGDIFDGEEDQGRRPTRADDLAGIEAHGLGADVGERVRDLEVLEGGMVGQNLLQELPEGRNVPLAVA